MLPDGMERQLSFRNVPFVASFTTETVKDSVLSKQYFLDHDDCLSALSIF